jgi:hypothetical protein
MTSSASWLAPALLTFLFLAGTGMLAPRAATAGDGPEVKLFQVLCYETAIILSLIAWLAWAVL